MDGYQSSSDYSWLNIITTMMTTVIAITLFGRIVRRMLISPITGSLYPATESREALVQVPRYAAVNFNASTIPWKAKQPLFEKYGAWAVNLAESRCPQNDVDCVEREARILHETMEYRRALRS